MKIFRVVHSDMMGGIISEEFFKSKSKAKKSLRKKFKELKPRMAKEEDISHLSEPLVHRKQFKLNGKPINRSFELMFEMWHKCSYEYDEWDLFVEGLHIDIIEVK